MRNYKVIDTFMFNGEFEMLKMRFDYLNDSVDYFVICESNYTQSGVKKRLTYLGNEHLFNEYQDKILYIVYEPKQEDIDRLTENSFSLEQKHMDFIRDNILHLSDNNTITMLSGVDEFPDKNKFDEMWERVKNMNMDAISYKMRTFYYSPICELDIDCFGTTVVNNQTLRNIINFSDLRQYTFNCPHIDGGWHLSFFHSPDDIKRKIETYAHSEFNLPDITNIDNIKYRMYNCLDVLNRPNIKTIKHDTIGCDFPIEFYRHDIFFRNIFERVTLKPWVNHRKKSASQINLEIENLQLMVNNNKSKVIVEIGSAYGGTLARWFELPNAKTIISIDLATGIHGGVGFEERTYVVSDYIEQANRSKKEFFAINGNSKDQYIINRLEEILEGRKIDFLFIDGDHTYDGVKGDFLSYEKFLHKDSIIGFHDIIDSKFHSDAGCFVSKFWNELNSKYECVKFVYTNLLDSKSIKFMYDISYEKGGFGGIGVCKYSKFIKEKISLMMPIYNNVNLAIKNINTTLNSSENIDEVVLYSNGTNNEENNILLEYANKNSKVKVYINQKPIGFVKAVNEGFKLCKNDLMICLNSDACLYDDWEKRLTPLWENKKNGLIGPVLQDGFILGCCFVVRKSILNKIGLLNEGFGLGYHDDGELTKRVQSNGYDLGYHSTIIGWEPESRNITFPMSHIQGVSFMQLDSEKIKSQSDWNGKKLEKFCDATKIKVLKDLSYEEIKNILNDKDVFVVINKSGENFEKIRFDEEIIKYSHIFECTNEMNINTLINSITKDKKVEIIESNKNNLTWLAKFDDYASMGILSQRILENLKNTDISCKEIIGVTETNNDLIKKFINTPINHELGIMFSYPDMIEQLNEFRTKVIYTGVDSTGGIPNFTNNSNKADFLLTPSNRSKNRMINLGVTKPIFVFPHGIEKNKFVYKKKTREDIFKFLYVGEASDRKGTFQLLKAFTDLFKYNSKVELHIKSNNAMIFYEGDKIKKIVDENPNIFWEISNEGHEKVLDLYNECHAYVYPSRADTFGMTIIEAMACGLPVISTQEPGASELIEGRYYVVPTIDVPVVGHPWMLGNWGEPDVEKLKEHMMNVYKNYDDIILSGVLEEHSKFINENYSWDKITENFEKEILPKLEKETKVITLLTSYNRPHHIKNIINSIKDIREKGLRNDVYLVDNTVGEQKEEVVNTILDNIDDGFKIHISDFNMGQRGALLQMLDDVNIDDYDYIQFTDQDNLLIEPISTYCDILNENQDITFVTGYMSKEHGELGWRKTRFGNLCEKRSLRAGHMFMRVRDLKSLYPIHLDGEHGQPWNSSWYAGLDWELTYWNKNSVGKKTDKNFVLCVPGGVIHKGVDSTFYEWDVEANEYPLEELQSMR